MKEAVVTICRKDPDKFEVRSKGSIGFLNLDNGFLKVNISTLEPDFYKKLYKMILKVYTWNHIKSFFNCLILLS